MNIIIYVILAITCSTWSEQLDNPNGWLRVQATREGLVGKTTASGHVIQVEDLFVALPDRSVLGRDIAVKVGNSVVICRVLDIGPHSLTDPYWQSGSRPLAETGLRSPISWGKARNRAGIDLSDGLWDHFGLDRKKGIVPVEWKFLN